MLLLLSGGINLKPGPTSNRVSQCFWKPFKNKGLHFLFFSVNSILPKLDKWKMIAGKTKTTIQSLKLTVLYPIVRLNLQVTAFFDVLTAEMGVEFHVMFVFGRIYVLIWQVPLWKILKAYFWIFFYLCKLFCQRYSLEQIKKHSTRTTCSSYTLIDHILTNFREKISQGGVAYIGILIIS